MKQGSTGVLIALALAMPALAQDRPAHEPSPGEIVSAAPKADWVAIAPEDLLVMNLASDRDGAKREVVIQLMPPPFSQGWVDNIRTLAKAHWWDGTSVYRVQDDYVAQWGGGDDKPEPKGLKVVPEGDYTAAYVSHEDSYAACAPPREKETCVERTYRQPQAVLVSERDSYAQNTAFYAGWPIGLEQIAAPPPTISTQRPGAIKTDIPVHMTGTSMWPIHCFGLVGIARGTDDTGSGADLYAVIDQAPRQLDRNSARAGRVIEGMENLSSLPRGHGELGFYSDAEKAKRTPIVSVRLASELPEAERPKFEYLSTERE